MIVYIDKKRAVLPESFSMEYVQENRLFGDSEGYSLSVDLPLRGCHENIAIFGHLNHKEIAYRSRTYKCMIVHGQTTRHGIVMPVSVTEDCVTVQFLEGRSSVKHDSDLEETVIQDINLPYPDNATKSAEKAFANVLDIDDGQYYLALPWINNYSGNIQNKISSNTTVDSTTGKTYYPILDTYLSYQIYLIKLAELIFQGVGYSCDLTEWSNSKWKYLLVWNTLPAAWNKRNFNSALPRWTVMEFIDNIERLTGLDFVIDNHEKTIKAVFAANETSRIVVLPDLIQEFEEEIDEEAKPEYIESLELQYADRGDNDWKIESCSQSMPAIRKKCYWGHAPWSTFYNYRSGWITALSNIASFPIRKIDELGCLFEFAVCYAEALGAGYQYLSIPKFFNIYGATTEDSETETTEVGIIPAWIADCTVDHNDYLALHSDHCIMIDCGEYDGINAQNPSSAEEAMCYKNTAERLAIDGVTAKTDEYLSLLHVTFWKKGMGHTLNQGSTPVCLKQNFNQVGVTNFIQMPEYGMKNLCASASAISDAIYDMDMTLTLRTGALANLRGPKIEPLVKYTFRWLSKDVPDIMSTFIIHGRRYLCAKIKTTWTIKGRSEEIEGEFYELL